MGVGPRFSVSQITHPAAVAVPGNPDPKKFLIQRWVICNGYVIMLVRYHGVTNFEGRKILMFPRHHTPIDIFRSIEKHGLDPHFSEDQEIVHPIARFIPTEGGWNMARRLAYAD